MVGLIAALALLSPPTGPVAVFWGGGRTWAVDTEAERLLVAPGWITSDAGGLRRYRITREARRAAPGPDRLPQPAHRWTAIERLDPGARAWTALTKAPAPPAEGQLFEEQQPIQFTGDTLALLRFRRIREGGATTDHIAAETLSLPAGAPRPMPPDLEPSLGWLRRTLPGLIEPCVDQPGGLLAIEAPGGHPIRWLALTGRDRCADRAHGLAMDRPPPDRVTLPGARWVDDRLSPDIGPTLSGVVDVRPGPDGLALVLSGPALPTAGLVHRDLPRLADPCAARDLTLWRQGRTRPLGRAPALDGARWLAADDPLREALAHWFAPADGPPCHRPLASARAEPSGHICRITEDGRPWAGPDDLAAAAWAEDGGRRVVVTVQVRDPERSQDDGVELYLGPGRRPTRVHLGADGLDIRAGRRASARIRRQLATDWRRGEGGYTARFELDRALLGHPPAITVRVDDSDPGVPGALYLWAAGAPIDGRNPRATPLEAP